MFSLDDTSKRFTFEIHSASSLERVKAKLITMGLFVPSFTFIQDRIWGIYFDRKNNQWRLVFSPYWENNIGIRTIDIIGYETPSITLLQDDRIELFGEVYYQDDIKELLKVAKPVK